MRLSQATQYALVALTQLSTAGPPIPCSALAKRGPMPERFLLQVLRTLVNAGLLKSTRGVDGGYRLAKAAGEITLADVVCAIDGPITAQPADALAALGAKAKMVGVALRAAATDVFKILDGITVAQLS